MRCSALVSKPTLTVSSRSLPSARYCASACACCAATSASCSSAPRLRLAAYWGRMANWRSPVIVDLNGCISICCCGLGAAGDFSNWLCSSLILAACFALMSTSPSSSALAIFFVRSAIFVVIAVVSTSGGTYFCTSVSIFLIELYFSPIAIFASVSVTGIFAFCARNWSR